MTGGLPFLTPLLCRLLPGGFFLSHISPVFLPGYNPSICGLYFSGQSHFGDLVSLRLFLTKIQYRKLVHFLYFLTILDRSDSLAWRKTFKAVVMTTALQRSPNFIISHTFICGLLIGSTARKSSEGAIRYQHSPQGLCLQIPK